MDILICARTKITATRTSSGLKTWQKCFPLGELVALPQTPSWILGRKDGKKKMRGRNVRKEGKGRRE